MKQLLDLYYNRYGTEPKIVEPITGSGSARQYYRLKDDFRTVIGTIGTDAQENRAFIGLTKHFAKHRLPVPEILAVSTDQMAYLQSDIGEHSLYDAVKAGRESGQYSTEEEKLLTKAVEILPHFQILGAKELDTTLCYPTPRMDSEAIHFDLNYFKYCFLKLQPNIEFNEIKLQHDFNTLAQDILRLATAEQPTLMLRDFQARNVILHAPATNISHASALEYNTIATITLYFIDYQGCRIGPAEYDLASFLWQSSAHYPQPLRERLIDSYIQSRNTLCPTDTNEVRSRLQLMVFFRLLQVLGAYGFRGLHERKPYFLNSIPPALDNLRETLSTSVADKYPYLRSLLQTLCDRQVTERACHINIDAACAAQGRDRQTNTTHAATKSDLTVTIHSFSYKKGLPVDTSGNGGGYIFDCRGSNNPGRYEQYKKLTGLDKPVIDFLEQDGEILQFLNHIYPLAETHVARYIERSFTHLMFSFGCTGGQHRSVYSAQHLAEHLRHLFPQIKIHLIHREQGIDTYL